MLRVNNSSIQTKRSAKNVSCVFEKKEVAFFDFLKKKNEGTHVLQEFIYAALRQFELHMYA